MKARLMAVIAMVCLLGGLLVGFPTQSDRIVCADNILVDDNFNKEATGAQPAGYLIEDKGGKVSIAPVPSEADKSLFLDDPGTTNIKISKFFAPQTGIITAQISFMQPQLGTTAKVIRLLEKDTNAAGVHIETVKPNIIGYKMADGTFTVLDFYKDQTWVNVTIVADIAAQKADVFINGVQKLTQAPFMTPVANIAGFDSYTPGTSAKGHFVDNVKIFVGK